MRLIHPCDCHPQNLRKGGRLFTPLLLKDDAKIAFDPNAGAGLSAVLESKEIAGAWPTHHRSLKDNNAPINIAEQVKNISDNLDQHPELLAFMQYLVEIELQSLGMPHKNDSSEKSETREKLRLLDKYLHSLPHTFIPEDQLPEDHQMVLEMVRQNTGQKPIRPMHTVWNSVKHLAHHIKDDAKEHPVAFGSLLTTSLGLLYFMNMRMGMKGTNYIDPKLMQVTDLDVDTLMDPSAPITVNAAEIVSDMRVGCHDHLKMLLGDNGADFVKNTLDAVDLFPQHCGRVKTLAQNAQDNLRSGYDFINSRIDLVVKDPAIDLANSVAAKGPFLDAFNAAANNTAEFIYAANTVENVVLHSIIFGSAVIGTVKIGQLDKQEVKNAWDRFSDFAYRTAATKPMNYVLCCSASVYSYMANNGYSPDMMWMGLGGLVAGELTHKAINSRKQNNSLHDAMLSVPRDIATLSNPSDITNNHRAEETHKPTLEKLKKPALFAGLASAATAADFALTGGQNAGTIAGTLGVTVPFLAYNVPEDATFHVIFGVAGAIVGGAWLAAEKAVKWTKDLIR